MHRLRRVFNPTYLRWIGGDKSDFSKKVREAMATRGLKFVVKKGKSFVKGSGTGALHLPDHMLRPLSE